MKANGAPEKIYINPNLENRTWLIGKGDISFIEYTRTDAFIEKAGMYLLCHLDTSKIDVNYKFKFIEEFIKYMKGE